MKACVHIAPMIGARPGELLEEEALLLAEHLEICATCRGLAADVEATEGLLSEGLMARANARDFAPFVDQVMARVQAGPLELVPVPGRQRPGAPTGLRGWLDAIGAALRSRVAMGSAVAVLVAVAAAAAFMYVRRHDQQPEPEQIAATEMDLEGGHTILQTSDGPVVLLEPDDDTGS